MKRLTVILVLVTIFSTTIFATCDGVSDADQQITQTQEKQMQEANREVPVPGMINYTEKRLLADIYTLCDQEHLICYAYIFANNTGKLIFVGKCEGYGMPYATQFSNPDKTVEGRGTGEFIAMPQPEPNGLFKPADARGTWIMLLDLKGVVHPTYIEPDVIVSAFPLDYVNQQ